MFWRGTATVVGGVLLAARRYARKRPRHIQDRDGFRDAGGTDGLKFPNVQGGTGIGLGQ